MRAYPILITMMAIFGLHCRASVEIGPYTVDEIGTGLYHIQDYNSQNPAGEIFDENGVKTHFNNCSDMYLLVDGSRTFLVDLSNAIDWHPQAAESLRQLVAQRNPNDSLVVIFTHSHGDHTGMLPAFVDDPKVQFWLQREDFEQMASRFPADRTKWYSETEHGLFHGAALEPLLVPGHTPGSMVFMVKDKDIMLAGDAIGSGHGVWIFNTEGFNQYREAVSKLRKYVEDPDNGIDLEKLRIYGGHYWQKDWLDLPADTELGIKYILEMDTLVQEICAGTAYCRPSGLGFRGLDTYFQHGDAIVTWNAQQAHDIAKDQAFSYPTVFRNADVEIHRIDDNTWHGNGHLMFNESLYLIKGDSAAILLDAGTRIPGLRAIVEDIAGMPVDLVATHVHPDHTGSAIDEWPSMWMNAADEVNVPAIMPQYQGEKRYLSDGQVFDLGAREIEVIFTPGHTPGSTTFVDKDRHYGFSADAFGSTNLLVFTNLSTVIASAARVSDYIKRYGIEYFFPGHFGGSNLETPQRVRDIEDMCRGLLDGTLQPNVQGERTGLDQILDLHGVRINYGPQHFK